MARVKIVTENRDVVNGLSVVARERAMLPVPFLNGRQVPTDKIEQITLSDGSVMHQCSLCAYAHDSAVGVRAHRNAHAGRDRNGNGTGDGISSEARAIVASTMTDHDSAMNAARAIADIIDMHTEALVIILDSVARSLTVNADTLSELKRKARKYDALRASLSE